MLGEEATKYCQELFEGTRDVLLKERDRGRQEVKRGLIHREDAEQRAGYPGIIQADIDYVISLGKARADAIRKAYEWDGQPLNPTIIEAIVGDVKSVLEQSAAGLIAAETGYFRRRQLSSHTQNAGATAKLGELSRQITRAVNDTLNQLRRGLTIRVYESKKAASQTNQEQTTSANPVIPDVLQGVNWVEVNRAWEKAIARISSDPQGAVTAARTLLETVCLHILEQRKITHERDGDLQRLYKATANALQLSPAQHTEEIFKTVLGGCAAAANGLAGLRNRMGDSHGRGMNDPQIQPRHARLAVNASCTVALFLLEAHVADSK